MSSSDELIVPIIYPFDLSSACQENGGKRKPGRFFKNFFPVFGLLRECPSSLQNKSRVTFVYFCPLLFFFFFKKKLQKPLNLLFFMNAHDPLYNFFFFLFFYF